ncbi:MAG: SpoIIIAH-like family protein [Lachnospiraceae bacterium]|nr:SpoIIIAH-like family protein [Lachnospiraceae bacterium]MCM1239587.1 SpoIIIAH-like family protein [Lachnospiraceae bacterium]MCM1303901.1 SpoIIIAH-like family protein [Butyrivibrio sp.]MCM1409036.1 SpoIIIAH-like family protein [Lachnospiraceae bacterium]
MKNLIKKNQLMITALAIMIAIAGYLQFAGTGLEEEYLATEGDVGIGGASAVDSGGIITENYTADGLLDLSEEDLMMEGLTEIESLDSDVDIIVEDYLDDGMEIIGMETAAEGTDLAEAQTAGTDQVTGATPDEDEIPGEAVFTSTNGVTILSDAKLLKEQTRARNKETLLEIISSEGLTDAQKQEAVDTMVQMTAIAEKEAAAEILLEAKGFKDVVVSINGNAVDVVVNAAELDDVMRAQIEDIVKRKTEVPAENIIISTVVQ